MEEKLKLKCDECGKEVYKVTYNSDLKKFFCQDCKPKKPNIFIAYMAIKRDDAPLV